MANLDRSFIEKLCIFLLILIVICSPFTLNIFYNLPLKQKPEPTKITAELNFIIISSNGVNIRTSYPTIDWSGKTQLKPKICAIEKGSKGKILAVKLMENDNIWYQVKITERGEEYQEKNIKTLEGEEKEIITKKTPENMTNEENCLTSLNQNKGDGWIIGKYSNRRQTITINLTTVQTEEPKDTRTFIESIKAFLIKIKYYRIVPMFIGIMSGFGLYSYAKDSVDINQAKKSAIAKLPLLFFISVFSIIFIDSYNQRLDYYARHYDVNLSWGFLGQLVQDLLNIFFNINDFLGNIAAGFLLTLLFFKFNPIKEKEK